MMKCLIYLIIIINILSCHTRENKDKSMMIDKMKVEKYVGQLDTATFGAGCFWCVEAIFQRLDGVVSVTSGYSGGTKVNPTYEEVCAGETGHAEVCQIFYDPKKLSYEELLEVFWSSHDPTTMNRQGADEGTQYRSVIFYHNQKQKEIAEKYKNKLNDERAFEKPVVTEISAYKDFYKAEEYHQNYYQENSNKPYCQLVIRPKLEKFEKIFRSKVKFPEEMPSR